jgi:hypothetical protein
VWVGERERDQIVLNVFYPDNLCISSINFFYFFSCVVFLS